MAAVPESAHHVDVVVAHTLVAATRLDAFEDAGKARRSVVLARAHSDLTVAQDALAGVDEAESGDAVASADEALDRLMSVVSGLQACVAEEASAGQSSNPKDSKAGTPNKNQRSTSKGDKGDTPKLLCAVSADEVDAAREAGASVGALIPYGAATTAEFAALNLSVKGQVAAEAAQGSDSTVTLPEKYLPVQ